MDRRNLKNVIFILLAVIILLSIWYKIWTKWTNTNIRNDNIKDQASKDDIIQSETEKYTKDAKKIDYTVTNTWFVLEPPTESKSTYLSWTILISDWKTLTWEYLYVSNLEIIKDQWKYLYKRELAPSWLENMHSKDSKNSSDKITSQTYELKFVKWLSKMKLLWDFYEFNENNLKYGNTYTVNLYISWNNAYVLTFENAVENKSRQEIYTEYNIKLKEIKDKYADDSYVVNKLIRELNKAYNIQMKMLK